MDSAQNQPKTAWITLKQDDLIALGHQLQRTNAFLDILWRAACHDANYGGYPEFVHLMRQQVGAISDGIISLANQSPAAESPASLELKGVEQAFPAD